jgi:hypothetical protein
MDKYKTNWWIDLILVFLFWVSFFPEATGLSLHEWLGAAAVAVAALHLITHWKWTGNTLLRFFSKTTTRARIFLLVDLGVFSGFCMILITGLLISTWLDLPIQDLAGWTHVHLMVSVFTLLLVVLKLILHWRWVATSAQRFVFAPVIGSSPAAGSPRAIQPVTRRDFLKVSGVLGAATVLTVHSLFDETVEAQAQSTIANDRVDTPRPSATAQASPVDPALGISAGADPSTAAQTAPTAAACVVLCPNGCFYPGRCRRYVDRNDNGKCDNGECL